MSSLLAELAERRSEVELEMAKIGRGVTADGIPDALQEVLETAANLNLLQQENFMPDLGVVWSHPHRRRQWSAWLNTDDLVRRLLVAAGRSLARDGADREDLANELVSSFDALEVVLRTPALDVEPSWSLGYPVETPAAAFVLSELLKIHEGLRSASGEPKETIFDRRQQLRGLAMSLDPELSEDVQWRRRFTALHWRVEGFAERDRLDSAADALEEGIDLLEARPGVVAPQLPKMLALLAAAPQTLPWSRETRVRVGDAFREALRSGAGRLSLLQRAIATLDASLQASPR